MLLGAGRPGCGAAASCSRHAARRSWLLWRPSLQPAARAIPPCLDPRGLLQRAAAAHVFGGAPAPAQAPVAAQAPDAPGAAASSSAWPGRTCIMHLAISNFALVMHERITVGDHTLVAVTGESGSGKSVLVEALALLLGASAPSECVRPPADTAVVAGSFWLGPGAGAALQEALREHGVPTRALPTSAPGRLDVRREVCVLGQGGRTRGVAGWAWGRWAGAHKVPAPMSHRLCAHARTRTRTPPPLHAQITVAQAMGAGAPPRLRSRCFINGAPVALRALRALQGVLVDMNGQHGAQDLVRARRPPASCAPPHGAAPCTMAPTPSCSRQPIGWLQHHHHPPPPPPPPHAPARRRTRAGRLLCWIDSRAAARWRQRCVCWGRAWRALLCVRCCARACAAGPVCVVWWAAPGCASRAVAPPHAPPLGPWSRMCGGACLAAAADASPVQLLMATVVVVLVVPVVVMNLQCSC